MLDQEKKIPSFIVLVFTFEPVVNNHVKGSLVWKKRIILIREG